MSIYTGANPIFDIVSRKRWGTRCTGKGTNLLTACADQHPLSPEKVGGLASLSPVFLRVPDHGVRIPPKL